MRVSVLMGATMLGAAATPAFAQLPTAPAQTGVPTREEVERARPPVTPTPPSKLTVDGGIERAPCALDDPRFANVMLTVTGAEFAGLRGLSAEDLRASYADVIGKRVPIAVVCQIRDAAATILRRAGYIAAVQVPPQEIKDGVIRFDVLMAKLVALRVRGNAGRSERLIAGYLAKLQAQPVFNEREAERYLLLARDLPGYDVRLTLRPAGGAPGEVVGEVTATRIPFAVDANIQNFGSKTVGRFGGLVTAQLNDIAGLGDQLTLGVFNTFDTREQSVLTGGYSARLGGEGLTLGARGTLAWTRPDSGAIDPLRSRTTVATVEAAYPFRRTQRASLRGAIGLDVIDQRLRFNAVPLTRDKVRAAYLRLDADFVDPDSYLAGGGYSPVEPRWRAFAALEVRRGLDILGASRNCGPAPLFLRCTAVSLSRIEADPTATVVRLNGQFEYRPSPRIAFVLQPRLQYSPDPLVSFEEYSGGNYTAGRGYDPGTIVGDSGVGFQSELRFGSLANGAGRKAVIQPFAFFDLARVWNNDSPIPITYPQRLYSAGGGIRAFVANRARVDLTVAQPLKKAGLLTRRGDTRLLLTVSTRLWPWS